MTALTETTESRSHYYVPEPSAWPVVVGLGIFALFFGIAMVANPKLNAYPFVLGVLPIISGLAVIIFGSFGWIFEVMKENQGGKFRPWEDRSFRIGLGWFIAAELFFFASFLGSMAYFRELSLPWLAGFDPQYTLWPDFKGEWPSSGPAGKAFTPLEPWGLAAVNTLLLIASVFAGAWARSGLRQDIRGQMLVGLVFVMLAGLAFMFQQSVEFGKAMELGIGAAGVYGTSFYTMAGIHLLHMFIGMMVLAIMIYRICNGHFSERDHFGIDGATWYWNFAVVLPGVLLFLYFYWV